MACGLRPAAGFLFLVFGGLRPVSCFWWPAAFGLRPAAGFLLLVSGGLRLAACGRLLVTCIELLVLVNASAYAISCEIRFREPAASDEKPEASSQYPIARSQRRQRANLANEPTLLTS
jgi:hypothetical protein